MTTMYAPHSRFIAYGDFLFKWRNLVFPLFLVSLFLAFPPDLSPPWLPWLGLALSLLGQCLRMAVIGFAYIKRGGLNKKVHADTLVTTGFFAACRNPLYVGNIVILGGLLLIHGNPWVIAIGSAFFLIGYQAIIATEENFLRNRFHHQYLAYCAHVPRWLIQCDALPAALKGMAFNWRKVIYKDYSTIGSWGTQAIALFAYRRYAAAGHVSMHWLYAAFALAALVLTVRIVKKAFPL